MAAWRERIGRLRATLHALRQLVADPEDTPKVFEIVRGLGLPSLRHGVRRFRSTPVGRRVLAERIDLLETLRDRNRLAGLPHGSLGRAYYDFVYRENLSADGLVEASMTGGSHTRLDNADTQRYAERLREQHDLWHTLTGYGRDRFGEVCLLAFTYAQTRNTGLGLIALVGTWKGIQKIGMRVPKAMWNAFHAGRHASWLPEQDWERLLHVPIAEVRRQLAVPPPARAYRAYRESGDTPQPAAA